MQTYGLNLINKQKFQKKNPKSVMNEYPSNKTFKMSKKTRSY